MFVAHALPPREAIWRACVCARYSEDGDFVTAAGWLCSAVFWSGGSIAGKDALLMEAPPFLYSQGVTGTVVILAGLGEPDVPVQDERYQQYVQHGIKIADGGNG